MLNKSNMSRLIALGRFWRTSPTCWIKSTLSSVFDQVTTDVDRSQGAIHQFKLYDGKAVKRIEEWDEANHAYVINLIDRSLPMKKLLGKVHAEDIGKEKTKLVAEMNVKAKYEVLGKMME
jgi:hypothetical protein